MFLCGYPLVHKSFVNRIGNILTPALLLVILLLIIKSFMTPLGGYAVPQPAYGDAPTAVLQGFWTAIIRWMR